MKAKEIASFCIVTLISSLSYVEEVRAESLCDVALKSGAFNISDFAHSARLVMKKKDEACAKKYASAGEAISSGKQSGGSIGYGPLTLSGSDAKQVSEESWSIEDSEFCKATAEDVEAFTSTVAKQQVADSALSAWTQCLDKMNRLNIVYTLHPDGTGFTGHIEREVTDGGAFGKITGVQTSHNDVDVTCRIGTKDIQAPSSFTQSIAKGRTAIACNKPAKASVRISISTDVGDTAWIDLPSHTALKNTSMKETSDAVNQLRQKLESVSQSLAAVEKQKNELQSKVDGGFQDLKSSDASLLQRITDLSGVVNSGTAWEEKLPHTQLDECKKNGEMGCMAGAHRYCTAKGGKGGFIQEWGGGNITFICVK